MGMQSNSTRELSAFSFGPCYLKAWLLGMQMWKHRVFCGMSWWRAHWSSCIRRFVVASHRGGHAVLPGYSVFGGFVSSKIWTHLLLHFCVVHVRVWVLQKVGLSMVSSPRKRCILARQLSVVHTVQVWPHVSQNISGACIVLVSKMQTNPGIGFSGASYGCSFLSIGCLSHHLSNLSR